MTVIVMELVNHEVLMAKDNHHILIVNADLIFISMIVQSSLVFYRRVFQYVVTMSMFTVCLYNCVCIFRIKVELNFVYIL